MLLFERFVSQAQEMPFETKKCKEKRKAILHYSKPIVVKFQCKKTCKKNFMYSINISNS